MRKRDVNGKSVESRASNAVLGAIAVIAVGIQFLRFVQVGPKLAAASASTVSDSPPAVTHDSALILAVTDIDDYQKLMQHTQQVVDRIKSLSSVHAVPATRPVQYQTLKINPFKVSRATSPFADQAAQERAATVVAAQEMMLQSVMHSELAHVCMINNVLLRENQQLNGFTIDKISSDSVIIHRGIYRFELRLLK
jgi:hypothetical protein